MRDYRSGSRSLYSALVILLLLVFVGASLPTPTTSAQQSARYFPETGHWLRGAFRTYWERNGSTQLFGYPLTEEYRRSDGRIVQWFERARFELASSDPIVIELGHVGVEFTRGRDFPKVAPFTTNRERRYFPETGHSLKGLFRTTWEKRGGVRIFGLPISEELTEAINGQNTLVQYFERARFELRFNPSRVEFGQLARPMTPPQLLEPWPSNALPAGPLNEDGTPRPPRAGMSIRVNPGSVVVGQNVVVQGEGFDRDERVSIWLTAPNGATRDLGAPTADRNGSISGAGISFTVDGSFATGRWFITAHGNDSGREVVGQFTVSPKVGNPAALGVMIHDKLRPAGDGNMVPLAAPADIAFTVSARGFNTDERIGLWLTRPDGEVVTLDPIARIDGKGSVSTTFKVPSAHEGVWAVTAEGVNSKRRVIVPFKVTGEFLAPLGTARPANRNGSASPAEGGRGTSFRISASGFRASETLEFWITSPDGLYVLSTPVVADSRGRIGISRSLSVQLGAQNPTGVYGYHYRGVRSGVRADVYFTYTGR